MALSSTPKSLREGNALSPRLDLFSFYYQIKRLPIHAGGPLCCCGSISFKIRRDRNYPEVAGHESVKNWTGSYFYCKDIPKAGKEVSWPAFVNGPAEPVASWSEPAPHPLTSELCHLIRQIKKLMANQLTGLDLVMSWFTSRIQPL
jgi:hypothetical protein